MPFSTNSGFAAEAGERTATRLPSRSRGRSGSRKFHLTAADHFGWACEKHLLIVGRPDHPLATADGGCAERALHSLQCDRGRRRRACTRAGGVRRADTALVDAELDLIRAEDAHKFHVRPEAKERIDGDLRAEFLPT